MEMARMAHSNQNITFKINTTENNLHELLVFKLIVNREL